MNSSVLDGLVPLDQLQQLTYVLSHMYPNWVSPIKVPFVIQCAHKVSFEDWEWRNDGLKRDEEG
jgi:hypothetical protein